MFFAFYLLALSVIFFTSQKHPLLIGFLFLLSIAFWIFGFFHLGGSDASLFPTEEKNKKEK